MLFQTIVTTLLCQPSGGGSLTSVATANGFAGSIASNILTISTTVEGLIKGDGTSMSAAIAGEDYVTPDQLTSFVPYNDADQDLDLGDNSLAATDIRVNGRLILPTLQASHLIATNGSNEAASVSYTPNNTASAVVQRDPSGNFSAGTLTLGGVSVPASGLTISGTTNGQLLIGNTTSGNLTLATLTAGTGVTIGNNPGAISLSIGQSVSTSVTPTFLSVTLSSLNANQAVVTSGVKTLTSLSYTALNNASSLVLRDGSGNFAAGTITATVTGNASTATILQTARNINGVSFNGSADITVTAAAGTLTGTTLNSSVVTSSLTSVGTLTSLTTNSDVTFAKAGTGVTETLAINAGLAGGASSTNVSQIQLAIKGGGGGNVTALQKHYINSENLFDVNFSGFDVASFTSRVNSNNSVQATYKYLLSGQEYSQAATTSTDGVAQVLFVNRSGNRQIGFLDSTAVASPNSTNAALRLLLGGAVAGIDVISTDGTTAKTLNIQANGGVTSFGGDVGLSTSAAGTTRTLSIINSNNSNAASHAALVLQTGGASGGDPKITYTVAGVLDISQGYDTSTSLYTISNSTNLGSSNMLTLNTSGDLSIFGDFGINTIGKGLKIKTGTNAKIGTATLNGVTNVVVSNTSVTANSIIFLTTQTPTGATQGTPVVVSKSAGTSFTIKSTNASDTSVVGYLIVEATP